MLAHINKSTKANDHSDSILFSQSDLISELWVLLKKITRKKKIKSKMMQSLMSMKACVGTRLPVLTNSEASTRKQRVNYPNRRYGRNVIVSCGLERNGNEGMGSNEGSFSHNYAILKHRMEKVAKSEVSVFVLCV